MCQLQFIVSLCKSNKCNPIGESLRHPPPPYLTINKALITCPCGTFFSQICCTKQFTHVACWVRNSRTNCSKVTVIKARHVLHCNKPKVPSFRLTRFFAFKFDWILSSCHFLSHYSTSFMPVNCILLPSPFKILQFNRVSEDTEKLLESWRLLIVSK